MTPTWIIDVRISTGDVESPSFGVPTPVLITVQITAESIGQAACKALTKAALVYRQQYLKGKRKTIVTGAKISNIKSAIY